MNNVAPDVVGANEQSDIEIDVLRWIRLARLVLQSERAAKDETLGLIFIDEATMTDLNVRYLDGDGPTDVLAFPLGDEALTSGRFPDDGGRGPGSPREIPDIPAILGDVLVCPVVAQQQARVRDRSLDDEISLLVVHGTLHLLGYDHGDPEEANRMQVRERELLEKFAAAEQSQPPSDSKSDEGPL